MHNLVRQGRWWLALACALAVQPAWAQLKTFNWTDELCEYQGTYDASRYSARQLQNTYDLWFSSAYQLSPRATVLRPDDIDKLTTAPIVADYESKLQKLKALDIVPQPYWQNLRKQTQDELEAVYQLSMVTVQGYKKPRALRKYPAKGQCMDYANALVAGDGRMMTAWEQLSVEQCRKNGYPQLCLGRYQQERESPQAEEYARINLMAYGWWNCNNRYLPHVERDGSALTEFRKLFKRVRFTCDEP